MNTLILGATSLIAEHVARIYAQDTGTLILVGRNEEKLNRLGAHLLATGKTKVELHSADLTDVTKHAELINDVFSRHGRIDRVLIAFGWLPDQKEAESNIATAMEAVSVNYAAPVSLLLLLANQLEKQRSGTVGVITSVAGDRGREYSYLYCSNKAALSTFTQGLRLRMMRSKVRVIDIRPGFVDTPMTAHLKKGPLFASAENVAQGIVWAMARNRSPIYVPWFWSIIMFAVRNMPEALLYRLKV